MYVLNAVRHLGIGNNGKDIKLWISVLNFIECYEYGIGTSTSF